MKIKLLFIVFTVTFVCLGSLAGCASEQKRKSLDSFDHQIRLYGRLLRWQELEGAVNMIRHQDESTVEVNLEDYKDLRVTDYEVKKVVMGDELMTAEVFVGISYYFETINSVETISDVQSWWYSEDAGTWFLDDDLPAF